MVGYFIYNQQVLILLILQITNFVLQVNVVNIEMFILQSICKLSENLCYKNKLLVAEK